MCNADKDFREDRDRKIKSKYEACKSPKLNIVSASLALPSLRRAMSKEDLNSRSILSDNYEESFDSDERSVSNFTSNQCISENEDRVNNNV